jgi:hypothetical protein
VICSEMIQMSITVKFGEETHKFRLGTSFSAIKATLEVPGHRFVLKDSEGYTVAPDESLQGGEYTACRVA